MKLVWLMLLTLLVAEVVLGFPANNQDASSHPSEGHETHEEDHNHVDQYEAHEGDDELHDRHDHHFDTDEGVGEDEVPSPYNVTEGQSWVRNVWQWLQVTPQHVIYVREPQLPWYGNLIKWLRINVLFEPVY
ncbi:uncharacterized protein LOC132192986 [Neocloeon triangulifer]|uniref:uncharacterized protein LOC132192986 n=1 Tax=Neocloeon triangulifer TaxID=2078957 RepID=UPI00286F788E|nr:uncharacterized protein LOC132192986 [Neocloeon triangulifer]